MQPILYLVECLLPIEFHHLYQSFLESLFFKFNYDVISHLIAFALSVLGDALFYLSIFNRYVLFMLLPSRIFTL